MDSPLPHGKIYQNKIAKWVVTSNIQVKWKGKFWLKRTETEINYLARYSRKTALSNPRILAIEQDKVAFHYKDYRDHNRNKVMALGGEELIQRFLLHILPKGFVRICHYGFLANHCRRLTRRSLCHR